MQTSESWVRHGFSSVNLLTVLRVLLVYIAWLQLLIFISRKKSTSTNLRTNRLVVEESPLVIKVL
jgi:hypothetical protein